MLLATSAPHTNRSPASKCRRATRMTSGGSTSVAQTDEASGRLSWLDERLEQASADLLRRRGLITWRNAGGRHLKSGRLGFGRFASAALPAIDAVLSSDNACLLRDESGIEF